jgi:hypothetical protein
MEGGVCLCSGAKAYKAKSDTRIKRISNANYTLPHFSLPKSLKPFAARCYPSESQINLGHESTLIKGGRDGLERNDEGCSRRWNACNCGRGHIRWSLESGQAESGIGVRFIQYLGMTVLIPVIVILSLENRISEEMTGAIAIAVVGGVLGAIGKDEKYKPDAASVSTLSSLGLKTWVRHRRHRSVRSWMRVCGGLAHRCRRCPF